MEKLKLFRRKCSYLDGFIACCKSYYLEKDAAFLDKANPALEKDKFENLLKDTFWKQHVDYLWDLCRALKLAIHSLNDYTKKNKETLEYDIKLTKTLIELMGDKSLKVVRAKKRDGGYPFVLTKIAIESLKDSYLSEFKERELNFRINEAVVDPDVDFLKWKLTDLKEYSKKGRKIDNSISFLYLMQKMNLVVCKTFSKKEINIIHKILVFFELTDKEDSEYLSKLHNRNLDLIY